MPDETSKTSAPGKVLHALKQGGEEGRRKRRVEAKVVGAAVAGEMLAALTGQSSKTPRDDKD